MIDETKIIKLPGPIRIVWGSLGCYWLTDIVNAGFFGIALMLLSLIPVLVIEKYFAEAFKKNPPENSA